ncbi:hypothetical protein K449DRAFT_392008 [Hypoxylon sp. EC38]|nr:hypothetical protein K449DRAFT_392008 [Hypoxylon sp. EC38]
MSIQSQPEVISSSISQGGWSHGAARPFFVAFEFSRLPTKIEYDIHADGFWDFPERAGWILDGQRKYRKFHEELEKPLRPLLLRLDKKYECRRRAVPEEFQKARLDDALSIKCFKVNGATALLSEEVSFLQAWLFFGTLHQLGSITGVRTPDFQSGTKPGILSTAPLETLVHSWTKAIKTLDFYEERHQKWSQILEVVQHVMSLQTCISTVRSRVRDRRRLTYDECKALMAIRLLFLAALLTLALSSGPEAFSDLKLLMEPALTQSFPANWDELKEFATAEMLALGWCKSECTLLEQHDGAYNFFSTRLTTSRWRMDHSKCHENLCFADNVDEETYKTVHVQQGCKCDWIHAKPQELITVLEKGCVPRITISKDGNLVVGCDQPYIAISHVWAHGLGNPKDNALPRCQIDRLANYISALDVDIGHQNLAIWMDTLCVPVHPSLEMYRDKAIKLMGPTYQDAVAVLVLDRDIQLLNTNNVSQFEQDFITAFIGWTRRLWTLQEAALARVLYVQTLGRPHKLENVASDQDNLLARICFWEDIAGLMRRRIPPMAMFKGSEFDKVPDYGIHITNTVLQKLIHAIKHRTTSKMKDEARILATTLRLEPQTIIDAPDVEKAMASLFVLLKDVPADIIFGNWPKLSHAPFRWAPRSLLGLPLQATQSYYPAATCDSQGLHVTYQGLLIDGRPEKTFRHIIVVDETSKMYEFRARKDILGISLPARCALILGQGVGHSAIARILGEEIVEDRAEIKIVIIGFLLQVGSGSLHSTAQHLFKGKLTVKDQCWCVT